MGSAITPSVPTATNVIRGVGILYKNYGLGTQREIGATKGDIKYVVDRKFMHTDYNGMYGPTEGMHDIVEEVASIEFETLDLSYQNFEDAYAGCVVSDQGAYHKITGDLAVAAGDYHDNIVWAGKRKDGKYVLLYISNALGDGKIELAIKDKDDVVSNVHFTGCYGTSTPTTPPWEIRLED